MADKNTSSNGQTNSSLFNMIRQFVQEDGSLPSDFALPKIKTKENLSFADGALDGITIYHCGIHNEEECEQRLEPLCEVLRLISANRPSQAEKKLLDYFSGDYTSMLPLIDDLQHWIIDNASDLNPGLIFTFSVNLIEESGNAECIKFAMSILEIMDIEENKTWRDTVCTLGLSDEFTLYSLFLIRHWSDASTVIFDLAKKIHGWGRIHAVEWLSPDTQEIKDWLLMEGYENDIMGEYSALTCVKKSGLPERLREKALTQVKFASVSKLIRYLLSEGPVDGISGLENPEEFLATYMDMAQSVANETADFQAILDIKEYVAEQNWETQAALLEECDRLLESEHCHTTVIAMMAKGKGFSVARQLGIDYADKAFQEIQNDFYEQYDLAPLLLEDGLYVDETIKLFEQNLPIDSMNGIPDDELGLAPEFKNDHILSYFIQFLRPYPNKGEKLILTALHSPVMGCRNMALNVLNDWKESGAERSNSISECLLWLQACEVDEEIKKRITNLLN